jgi:hypothetical protein
MDRVNKSSECAIVHTSTLRHLESRRMPSTPGHTVSCAGPLATIPHVHPDHNPLRIHSGLLSRKPIPRLTLARPQVGRERFRWSPPIGMEGMLLSWACCHLFALAIRYHLSFFWVSVFCHRMLVFFLLERSLQLIYFHGFLSHLRHWTRILNVNTRIHL